MKKRTERKTLFHEAFSLLSIQTILFFFFAFSVRADEGMALTGILTVNDIGGVGEPIPHWSSTNAVHILLGSNGRLLIEIRPLQEENDVIYSSFDGTSSFFIRYRESDMDNKNWDIIGKTPVTNKTCTAYLSSGNYPFSPFDEEKRSQILWLVFGSGDYFSKTNVMPVPWISARYSLVAYGFRAETKLMSSPPYIPQELRFIRDDKLDLANEDDEFSRPELDASLGDNWIAQLKHDLVFRKSKWKDGMLYADLDTVDFTNKNGFEIPMSFDFTIFDHQFYHVGAVYYPGVKNLTNTSQIIHWHYKFNVTNIGDLPANTTFQPPILSRKVFVMDSRFRMADKDRALNMINYMLDRTNNWLPIDSPNLIGQFKAGVGDREVSGRPIPSDIRKRRIAFTALFAIVFLLFPVYILYPIFPK